VSAATMNTSLARFTYCVV